MDGTPHTTADSPAQEQHMHRVHVWVLQCKGTSFPAVPLQCLQCLQCLRCLQCPGWATLQPLVGPPTQHPGCCMPARYRREMAHGSGNYRCWRLAPAGSLVGSAVGAARMQKVLLLLLP